MQRNWQLGLVVGMLCLTCGIALQAQQPEAKIEYLTPESFAERGREGDFLPYARDFLNTYPRDERGPRVALDMWMVATARQNTEFATEAKVRLLLEHPDSLPTSFLLMTSKADDVRAVLRTRFQAVEPSLDRKTLYRFSRAFDLYLKQYGQPADDEFLAQGALAADTPLAAAGRYKHIKKADSEAAQLVTTAVDPGLSQRDKFIRLQTLRNFKSAQAYQLYLYHHELSDEERREPLVESVVVENLLNGHAFDAALARLPDLRKQLHDPKLTLWHAWALAATNDTAGAIALLNELNKTAPTSPWAKSGETLRAALETLEANLQQQIKVVDRVAGQLIDAPLDVLELRLTWSTKDNVPLEAYASLDLAQEGLELMAFRRGEPLVGYRVAAKESRIFIAGEPVIHTFGDPGICPVFNAGLKPKPEGGYNFDFNFNTTKSGSGMLRHSVRRMLSSPELLSQRNRAQLLRHAVTSGTFPERVQTVDGQTVLRWLRPQLDKPELSVFELRVSPEHRLTSIVSSDGWSVRDIRYGAQDLPLSPPRWPNLPIQASKEMGAAEMFRLFGAVVSLFEDKPAEPNIAKKPVETR